MSSDKTKFRFDEALQAIRDIDRLRRKIEQQLRDLIAVVRLRHRGGA